MLAALVLASSALAAQGLQVPTVTDTARKLLEIQFETLPFAEGVQRHEALVSDSAVVDGETYNLKYNILQRSGNTPVPGGPKFGELININGKAIPDPENPGTTYISNSADFSSLMPVGDKIYQITHFETVPAASYLTTIEQDKDTGELTVVATEPMDWSDFGGLWVPCAGSVTPWNSHFGSEEYEPDARVIELESDYTQWPRVEALVKYFGVDLNNTSLEEMQKVFKPYRYGYNWEAAVSTAGKIKYQAKHYTMGRLAIELPYTMPDKKTVYITDDGDNVMLGLFVATKPGDMTCGSLYAGKFNQIGMGLYNAGDFTIEWIKVGAEACNDDIEAMIETTAFSDIFSIAEPDVGADGEVTGSCPRTYTSINAQGGLECLRLNAGMQLAASRFEFRRYAAMLGATTEFTKWEGITFDPTRNMLYTGMSAVRRAMEDYAKEGEPEPKYDIGGANHIRVPHNDCGCVYKMEVDPVTYLAITMSALICGDTDANTDENNSCNKESISSPDNVSYVLGHDGLIIGEDTDGHQNDVMWYYDLSVTPATLTRFLSTPYGSETTSPYWYPDINGFSYLMAVIQHPYGESDEDKLSEPESTGLPSYVGYVGPFKAPKDLPASQCGGECVPDHGKCSGRYVPTKKCCNKESICVEKNAFYAQCMPASKIMTKVAQGWTGRDLRC